MNPQIDALRRGVDILVATPGRLLDHVQQKTRRPAPGRDPRARRSRPHARHGLHPRHQASILALLPAQRQNLLFSATFPDEIRKLAAQLHERPGDGRGRAAQHARRARRAGRAPGRRATASASCSRTSSRRTTGSRCWSSPRPSTAPTASPQQLRSDGIHADAIHGNKSQNARTRALERLQGRQGARAGRDRHRGARPRHRGAAARRQLRPAARRRRTTCTASAAPAARAPTGEAVSLVSREDRPLLAAIERLINRKIESRAVEGFEPGTAAPRHEQQAGAAPRGGRRPQQRRQGNGQRPQQAARAMARGNRNARQRAQQQRTAAAARPRPEEQQRRRPRSDAGFGARGPDPRGPRAHGGGRREAAAARRRVPRRAARASSNGIRAARSRASPPTPSSPSPIPRVRRRSSRASAASPAWSGALLGRKRENEE